MEYCGQPYRCCGGIEEEEGVWGLQGSAMAVLSTEGCGSRHSVKTLEEDRFSEIIPNEFIISSGPGRDTGSSFKTVLLTD